MKSLSLKSILLASIAVPVFALQEKGLTGISKFNSTRNLEAVVMDFGLWNRFLSVPNTFSAWHSLNDPSALTQGQQSFPHDLFVSEHTFSMGIKGWNHMGFSMALPLHVQSIDGALESQTLLGLGDLQLAGQKTQYLTQGGFWLGGVSAGMTVPTATDGIIPRSWDYVDRTDSRVVSQLGSKSWDVDLGILTAFDFATITKIPLVLDFSWGYRLGGILTEDRSVYGDRVYWTSSAQYVLDTNWNFTAGFWGNRDLEDWNYLRSSSGFGTGVEYNRGLWSYQMAFDWGINNHALSTQNQSSKYTAQTRMDGDFEYSLGVSRRIVIWKDLDRDGVLDWFDACTNTPFGAKVDVKGCSLDSDQDGVVDELDQCPTTPLGRKVDAQGCELDSDKDGVLDGLDLCPNTPRGREVDNNGCELDSDKDGVIDALDYCPGTPLGTKVDVKGCTLDPDGDGIIGDADLCPTVAETVNAYKDQDGCPDELPPMAKQKVLVLKGVNFQKGSDVLLESSKPILDTLAQQLIDFPESKVEVAGHTSSEGIAKKNTALSQARAQSVVNYIISRGVVASRLVAKGYGSTVPVADNKTEKGREKNRRVEFRRVE